MFLRIGWLCEVHYRTIMSEQVPQGPIGRIAHYLFVENVRCGNMQQPLPTPHNNFFYFAMTHLFVARNLVEFAFPSSVVDSLDLDSLRIETGSFVDAKLREKHSDVLLSAESRMTSSSERQRVLIYVLIEHKSEVEQLAALQLLSYMIRVWEQLAREGRALCEILPVVIYHGEKPWTAAKSIRDLISRTPALAAHQLAFEFQVLDLNVLADEQIGGQPILQSVLQLLKYSRSSHLALKLVGILRLLADSGMRIDEWLQAVRTYVMAVNKEIGYEELNQIVHNVFPTQIEPGSLADRLLKQGRGEGIVRGELIGKVRLLCEMLGQYVPTRDELSLKSNDELEQLISELQSQRRNHGV